ncbi:MAG: cytochrome c-type biogenesis CcmF C-terminal domain-containing protein, partial [Aquabacterium sp.]
GLAPVLLPAWLRMMPAAMLRWGRDEPRRLWQRLAPALLLLALAAVVLPIALYQAYGTVRPLVLLALLGASAAAAGTLQAAVQRLRSGRLGARAAGMLLAHAGVAVLAVGMALVKGYGIERDVRLAPGDHHTVGGCDLRFDGLDMGSGPNWQAQVGRFTLRCPGDAPRQLVSEKRRYIGTSMPMTESAIDAGLARDIYVALGSPQDGDAWGVRVQYKPFVRWIWVGVMLMAAGALLAAGAARRAPQPRSQPRPQGLPGTPGTGGPPVSLA